MSSKRAEDAACVQKMGDPDGQKYHAGRPIFTALHAMQTRYCDENSVRPSVSPSVRHTRAL